MYTLGKADIYDAALARRDAEHPLLKMGRDGGFIGGSVWRTHADAESYRAAHSGDAFKVYALDAAWDSDASAETARCGGECDHVFHHLLRDAAIVAITGSALEGIQDEEAHEQARNTHKVEA